MYFPLVCRNIPTIVSLTHATIVFRTDKAQWNDTDHTYGLSVSRTLFNLSRQQVTPHSLSSIS